MAKLSKKEIEFIKSLGAEIPDEEDSVQEAREEEALAAYLDSPRLFSKKDCQYCGKRFAVNRANVGFCSTKHRQAYLKETFGLVKVRTPDGPNDKKWVWEMWRDNEPLVVPPQALRAADNLKIDRPEEVVDVVHDAPSATTDGLRESNDGPVHGVQERVNSIDEFLDNIPGLGNLNL